MNYQKFTRSDRKSHIYDFVIHRGKRTEWSLIRSVIIRVITKLQESDLLITSMITDRHWTTRRQLTN